MHRSLLSGFFLLTALIFLISACAKVSSPTGGPKDRQPPVVLKCVPENGARNFRGKIVSITFDEYVVLDNITEKFMVSPPMKKKPRIFIKGKSVNVEFEDKRKDSTTYTFYFQDAIKDLNEGNLIENYQFVFSTGSVIDSLSVTGNVFKAFNLEVPEKTMVLMYSNLEDSAVVKNLPDYISRVDQTGYFRIDNVRAGRYNLYALTDADNSKNYNLTEQGFAFMGYPVDISPDKNYLPVVKDTSTVKKEASPASVQPVKTGEYQLVLFTALKKDHYLSGSSRNMIYLLEYTLSMPPDSMKFEFSIPGTSSDAYKTESSRRRDTLKVWLTDSTLYSQPQITTIVNYPFTDTLGILDYKEDTVLMRFLEPRVPRSAKVKKPPFKIDINIRSGSLKPGQQIVFNSETPLRQPDETRIWLYEVADTNRTKVLFSFFKDSTNSCRYIMQSKLMPGKKYLFIADSASFGNIYGDNIDSTGIRFTIREADSYNLIKFTLNDIPGNLIIQLLNTAEKLLGQVKLNQDGNVVFPLLEQGKYRARSIYDLNGDGEWTTGDFTLKRQPEPVSYYQEEIELKPGWNVESDNWNLELRNMKDQKLKAKTNVKR